MSLMAGLYIGSGAIQTNQVALQVSGNNIANSSTPGYVREEINLGTVLPTKTGLWSIGNGVTAAGTLRKIDKFLTERAREASSLADAGTARSTILQRAESVFNELQDNDISSLLSSFYNGIQDLQSNPTDPSLRGIITERATLLTSTIQSIRDRLDGIRNDVSNEVVRTADQINSSLEKLRDLNKQIVAAEAGQGENEANNLRTLRDQELLSLGSKIKIQVIEQPNGSINVFSGTDYLLFDGSIQGVTVKESIDRELATQTLVFENSSYPVPTEGGRLGGIQEARDSDLGQVIDALDRLSSNLIYEFNRIYSSGQGTEGFRDLTSVEQVFDPAATLNSTQANLNFPPQNGSFELKIRNQTTGLVETSVISVDLDGIGADDSLNSIVAKINAAFGTPAASVVNQGQLRIQAPTDTEFFFANDSSGFLASMGLNTFFTGNDSRTIGVNSVVRSNPQLFAASTNVQSGDSSNAVALSQLKDRGVDGLSGLSIRSYYTALVGDLGSIGYSARVNASTLETARSSLEAERASISGVSLDEETVKLIAFQRGFQAAARYVSTVNSLLEDLINLGA